MSSASYRPLIALAAYHLAPGRVARWPEGGYGVPDPYVEALRRARARIAIVAPGEEGEPEEILSPFDGLVLVGGGDVDPSLYGQEPGEHNYGLEPDRDELEIAFLHAADRVSLPTLCICRGAQVMNVAFGGTLHQHLPGMAGMADHGSAVADAITRHDVRVARDSLLLATTGVEALSCSSHHHQGIDRLGEGLVATGWSEDGLVEAVERKVLDPYTDVWMLGVQWHPEDTASRDPSQQALFDGLTILAKVRGSHAKPGESHGRTREYAIVDYDPGWPSWFQEEADKIRSAFGPTPVRIEHVGSTSVPGLGAKPVIDIQVSVPSLIPRAPMLEPFAALGFRHQIDPIETDHEYLSKGYDEEGVRKYHVHLCEAGGEWERRHLAFRDHLRTHAEDAGAYERLKRDLATRHPRDIFAYVDGKTAFITEIETRALAERPGP